MWTLRRWSAVLLCSGLLLSACGKDDDDDKKKDNNKKNDNSGDGAAALITDDNLVGTWGFDAGSFKIEKTFAKDGVGEEKLWENGSLSYHTINELKQTNTDSQKRITDKVKEVKVAKGSFAGLPVGLTQKCLYRIDTDSQGTRLTYECGEDYPATLPDDANVLLKQ